MNLKITGFKSVDREIDLDRLNLIVGANGAGKSAIADAIRFLALGYVPALGKREQDTAALMSNGRLEVVMSLGDGRTATRTLERDGEGYRSTVRASWVRGSRAEHEAAILKLFGSDAEDVAEALDIRELLSLSPAKRAARIEKMVGSGATDSLPARVARLHVARMLDTDPDQLPEKLADAIGTLPPSRASALRGVGRSVTTMLREQGIPGAIAWANEAKRQAEATERKRHAARDEIEARLGTLGGTLGIDDLEAQRKTILEQRGAIKDRVRREAERTKQLDAATSAYAQLENTVEDAQQRLDRMEGDTAQEYVKALLEKLPQLDEAIGALKSQRYGMHVDTRRIDQLEAELAGLTDEPVGELARYERIVEDLEQELAGAKASPWAEVRNLAAMMQSIDIDFCPEEVRRLIELADANMTSTAEIEAGLEAARSNLKTRGDNAAAAAIRNVERAQRRTVIDSELRILREQLDGANSSVKERERKRDIEIEGYQTKKKAALDAIAKHEIDLTQQRVHVSELREKLAGLASRIMTLRNTEAPMIAEVDTGELERIETAIAAATQRRSLGQEFEQIVAELEERAAEVEVYRALEWALQRAREEQNATRGAGIVGAIANFLHAAGRDELPYMESSKNLCEVGWVRSDKRRVSIEAMSGGEYSLFCSALTAAILASRPAELKLLMIEAAEADGGMLGSLLSGIEGTKAITNALVLTAHDPSDGPRDVYDQWHFIGLQVGAAERAA